MIDPGFLLDLEQRFGILESVKGKLISQPDKASEKLTVVMDELYKMYSSLDDAIVSYLSVYFDSPENIAEGRRVLLDLEVGKAMIRINESRGHCHKIRNIYEAYLDKWFSRVLDSSETAGIRSLFDIWSDYDFNMLNAMFKVNEWLKTKAEDTLNAIENNNIQGANDIVRIARGEVKQTREFLTHAMNQLRVFQAEFIHMSKVV
jgi:hypothetical protein